MNRSDQIQCDIRVRQPEFEAVRETFAENFKRRNELDTACCIYYRGEKVVDLWGGKERVDCRTVGRRYDGDRVFGNEGVSSMAMALAHSRRLFDYDEPISKHWPEFAQQGNDKITIRQLLAHQSGLFAFDEDG